MEVGARPGGGGGGGCAGRAKSGKGRVRVKRETLEAVLDQCQQTLELLTTTGCVQDDGQREDGATVDGGDHQQSIACRGSSSSPPPSHDGEADMLCSLLKSRVECPSFLEKLESRDVSAAQNFAEERNSWVVIGENDAWEGGKIGPNEEEFVLVGQDDIADGIASFMAAYLLSLKETKDLSPNQLQDALSKTFSSKKKKGKLRQAWDGSVVVYNVASWSATAIGIYQNPTILKTAFWASFRVISKLF